MARWQRDPRARQNLAYLLALVEVLAVTAGFYFIFSAYLHQVNLRLSSGPDHLILSLPTVYYVALGATIACFAVSVLVGVMYARGRPWARRVLIVANVVLVVLGVVWFAKNRIGGNPDITAATGGLLLPLATLFPLLWPLVAFRPKSDAGAASPDG
jgi:hypothetical protein